MGINRFEDMKVWKSARALNREIYSLSGMGKFSRDFGLRDQIRRASVSILSNIAEGFDGQSNPVFVRFLGSARASAAEVRAQLYSALDVGYITQLEFDKLHSQVIEVSRQLTGLIKYLRRSNYKK